MFAEYEKAQLAERYRRGKAWRAKTGSVNVLSGAPFGYRYIRKTPETGARYEVLPHEAVLVSEMFRRYADEGAAIADLRRWLTDQGVRTRTGKERWDRSVIWGMLRNPAYAGTAVFGKTQAVHEAAGLNRTARLAGRTVPRQVRVEDRPREEWTAIPVPALVDQDMFDRVQQRPEDNKRFAARSTKVPSLLQGLAACASCGYGYYRTSTTTSSGKKICYYRCLGSDDYRYQGVVSPARLQAHAASALVYAAQAIGGPGWARAIALSVTAATGTGIVLTARIVYGMASRQVFPPVLSTVSRRFSTPGAGQHHRRARDHRGHLGLPDGRETDQRVRQRGIRRGPAVHHLLHHDRTGHHRLLPAPDPGQRPRPADPGPAALAAAGFLGWVLLRSLQAAPAGQLWSVIAIIAVGAVLMLVARPGLRSEFFAIHCESAAPGMPGGRLDHPRS
jgi:recombinase